MGLLVKADLKYKYSWTVVSGDDPDEIGEPDRSLLNRSEGYEILPFINNFAKKYSLEEKASGLKVEKMIQEDVPKGTRKQDDIKKWIFDNWKKF